MRGGSFPHSQWKLCHCNKLTDLNMCLQDIDSWIAENFLQHSDNKSQYLDRSIQPPHFLLIYVHCPVFVKSHSNDHEVIFDSTLKFNKQRNCLVKSSFNQLGIGSKFRSIPCTSDLEEVFNYLFLFRASFSLFHPISSQLKKCCSKSLNNVKKRDHIISVLASLHWLPVSQRITFKKSYCLLKVSCLHTTLPETC